MRRCSFPAGGGSTQDRTQSFKRWRWREYRLFSWKACLADHQATPIVGIEIVAWFASTHFTLTGDLPSSLYLAPRTFQPEILSQQVIELVRPGHGHQAFVEDLPCHRIADVLVGKISMAA